MDRELPLYIFLRNALFLCLLFFVISGVIIEKGRHDRGENSLFNSIMIKQDDIIKYNNFDITRSNKTNTLDNFSNYNIAQDTLKMPMHSDLFSVLLIKNSTSRFAVFDQIEL